MTRDLWSLIPEPWQKHLANCRDELAEIDSYLNSAQDRGEIIVPDWENIFAALTLAPEQVKVVILGQDPYPNSNHGIGLAFAVPIGTKPLPGSLRNILKEVEADLGQPPKTLPDLAHWVAQGVLLINTGLTTFHGGSNSHAKLPWDRVVAQILKAVIAANPKVIAILWGNSAQSYAPKFATDRVLVSVHPSPLSAHRGFIGSKPFSKTNAMLRLDHKEGIDW
jgi:uracil-DNA glycosylase